MIIVAVIIPPLPFQFSPQPQGLWRERETVECQERAEGMARIICSSKIVSQRGCSVFSILHVPSGELERVLATIGEKSPTSHFLVQVREDKTFTVTINECVEFPDFRSRLHERGLLSDFNLRVAI